MRMILPPASLDNPLVRVWVVGVLGVAGCFAGGEEVSSEVTPSVQVPKPSEPEVARASGRWEPRNDAPGVCAWLGGEFTIADFVAVSEPLDPYCVNYAWCGWQIEAGEEPRLYVEAPRFLEPKPAPMWPLPFERPAGVEPLCRNPAIAHRVEDGWLVALNEGEWGAAVWWLSNDGSETRLLSELAVVGFFARSGTIWAPGRGRSDDGVVLRFSHDEVEGWRANTEAQRLRSGALAASLDGDTLLVATFYSVEAVDLAGDVEVLAQVDWFRGSPRSPRSIARLADGTILVGMSHAVVRLTPEAGVYREEWLVPPACAAAGWVPGRIDCACAGLEPPGFSRDSDVMFERP